MARIFSISFHYEEIRYSALIDVRSNGYYTEYNITALEDSLNRSLPASKVISAEPGHFVFPNADTGNEVLMNSIIKAISDHIHSLQH